MVLIRFDNITVQCVAMFFGVPVLAEFLLRVLKTRTSFAPVLSVVAKRIRHPAYLDREKHANTCEGDRTKSPSGSFSVIFGRRGARRGPVVRSKVAGTLAVPLAPSGPPVTLGDP